MRNPSSTPPPAGVPDSGGHRPSGAAPIRAATAVEAGSPGEADSPPAAEGRRTLSAAFVRVGPDGVLTVQRRDGSELVLRDVVMRPNDYCGAQVLGAAAGAKYCGGYAEVAAARPGGLPAPAEPDLAAANPLEPGRTPSN